MNKIQNIEHKKNARYVSIYYYVVFPSVLNRFFASGAPFFCYNFLKKVYAWFFMSTKKCVKKKVRLLKFI